jgi:hypothetical protein
MTENNDMPLYTKQKWQGLTDKERAEIVKSDPYRPTEMMKLAETKLKEKNTSKCFTEKFTEKFTEEPHIDGYPFQSGLPPPAQCVETKLK